VLDTGATGLESPIPATELAGVVVNDGDVDALAETNPVATGVGATNDDEDASMATELEIAEDEDGEEEDNEDDEEDSGGSAEDCDERSSCCRCQDT